MPNWCTNSLTVSGKNAKAFIQDCTPFDREAGLFSFDCLLPTPKEMLDGDGWYQWRITHWGTKWDAARPTVIELGLDTYIVDFDTAWSPPEPWLKAIAVKYPETRFRLSYYEMGSGFAGYLTIDDGFIEEECYDHQSPDEYWQFLGDEFEIYYEDYEEELEDNVDEEH